ncbi:FAD-dependent oxidoreductase [Actinotalea sp. K2]|uniref:NAD(P)/FAD-dependent oxidoreductase n=1 Tax=Actinotalea sp. K2 TaxID=2939438 RepID=UPI0020174FBE|nr:FAD-dependent oxidoreductase [Actinotalea sp. K2]MCL3859902.1 FAD-dependent oxidoreductase [Actinotalea sp. K2]
MPTDLSQPDPGEGRPPSPTMRSVVVVGAGLAAAQTVAALRAEGFDGCLTVLGGEGLEPYDRPPLSKELLTRTEPAWLRDELGTDLHLADDVRLAEPATGLTLGPHDVEVVTSTGGVRADAAVLATGSTAVRPPGWQGALTLHTAADAHLLRTALTPGARLVVIGAGWIGAEVAGVAAAAGVEVTVVEAASAPLATALGADVGALTVPWYAAAGVRLVTGARVVRVGPGAVELADGEVLGADVVLAAVGARPASGWWGEALPVSADGSLAVDEQYRVIGAPGRVVAVGDLARRRSPRHGWVAGGHWDGALRGPATAVRGLLGHPARGPADDPAPYVFSTQLGHELAGYGVPGPLDDVVLRGDPATSGGVLWFTAGTEELRAVLVVDRPRDVAAARRLFSGASLPHLDRAVAADPDRSLRDAAR